MMIGRPSVAGAWCRHVGCRQVEGDTDKGASRPKRRKIAETYINQLASVVDVEMIWSKFYDTALWVKAH